MAERAAFTDCLERFAHRNKLILRIRIDDTFDAECLEQIGVLLPKLNNRYIEQCEVYNFLFDYDEVFPDETDAALVAAVAAMRRAGFDAEAHKRRRHNSKTTPAEKALATLVARNLERTGALARLGEALDAAIRLCEQRDALQEQIEQLARTYGTSLSNHLET